MAPPPPALSPALQGGGPAGEAAADPLACPDALLDSLLQGDAQAAQDLDLLLEELAGDGEQPWAAPGADPGHLVSPRSPGPPWAFGGGGGGA